MTYRIRLRGITLERTLQYYEDFHRGTLKNDLIQDLRVIRIKSNGECGSFRSYAFFEIKREEEKRIVYTIRLKKNKNPIAFIHVKEMRRITQINVFVEWEWEATPFIKHFLIYLQTAFDAPQWEEMIDNEPSKEQMMEVAELNRRRTQIAQQTTDEELTNREIEIANLLAQGYSKKQIAFETTIAMDTVETHCANLKKKWGISGRATIEKLQNEAGRRNYGKD